MTLNDFKSVEGDRRIGIFSLPVLLGVERAATTACLAMAMPQVVVIALLLAWGAVTFAFVVALLLMAQLLLMVRLLRQSARDGPLVQRDRHDALRDRHAGHRVHAAPLMTGG